MTRLPADEFSFSSFVNSVELSQSPTLAKVVMSEFIIADAVVVVVVDDKFVVRGVAECCGDDKSSSDLLESEQQRQHFSRSPRFA